MIEGVAGRPKGDPRILKSILGELHLNREQARLLGVRAGKQISPYLELCWLHLSANVSYAKAQEEIVFLTGISVLRR